VSFAGPLVVDGPYFTAGGALVYPLGLTGFLLRKRFLTGLESEALAYLDLAVELARAAGDGVVALVREFSEVDWTGPPGKGVEPGFFARDFANYDDVSHRMYDAAQQRGVYLQTVALTYRHSSVQQAIDHCARVDRIAAQHANATFQAANEPSVNDIAIEDIVRRFTPTCRPADTGRLDPSPHPGWDYVGDHPGRSNESCRYFKGGIEVQDGSGPNNKFQPPWKNAFYQDEPGRLEDVSCWPASDDLASWIAGNRLFCAGGLIHGGLWAQGCHLDLLTPDIRVRLDAMTNALRQVPHQRYSDYQHPDDQGSLRRYRRRGADGAWYEISVRPFGFVRVS
jgi:hypothetical protein